MTEPGLPPDPYRYLRRQTRWHPLEYLFWIATILPFFLFPNYLSLASQIAITALFALSLDLILGYAGIVSLGHAAFFGIGAYAAGIITKHGYGDPILGLFVAALFAGVFGYATSFIIARFKHLALIMITLGIGFVVLEAANSAHWLTGGADGLQGVAMGPVLTPFGAFEFDIGGRVACAYSMALLVACLLLVRRLVHSPFGFSLQALRDNPVRAASIGLSVHARLIVAYTVGGAIGGVAGALLAQTNGFASLDVLDFHRSAEVLLVLVIGGTGYLYGGLFGAVAFKLLHDLLSAWTPQYWNFWIGVFLVVLVIVGRERLLRPWSWGRR